MIRYLADITIPLHTAVHKVPFQRTSVEKDAYECLKKMLTKVLVVQPPDWNKPFHVFVDASDIAISSALMQLTEPNWYRLVYNMLVGNFRQQKGIIRQRKEKL